MKMRIAIIGTREVSEQQIVALHKIISSSYKDLIVHSGGAYGVDQVATLFDKTNVFLPWRTYNKEIQTEKAYYMDYGMRDDHDKLLFELFSWTKKMSPGAFKMIRRNTFIVLGDPKRNIPQVDKVVYYTGKGITGGTAYGVRIAQHFKIPTKHVDL